MRSRNTSKEPWVKNLPAARIKRPRKASDHAKYFLWRAITPLHPPIRKAVQAVGLRSERFVHHETPGRQNFLLGTLAHGKSAQDLASHLVSLGYGNHFLAWHDEGQVVSLRLVESFTHQFHIRIFEDGEVRGHYEFTPESYPIKHLLGDGQIDRRDVFRDHLFGFVKFL